MSIVYTLISIHLETNYLITCKQEVTIMSNVKKAFVELVEFLKANENKKIATILPEVEAMCAPKQSQKNFITDDSGNVTHIFCYYHKKWEAVDSVEFGKKKHSATGLNSMCKEGLNNWTKQQAEFKKSNQELLNKVASGEIKPEQILEEQAKLEEIRKSIVPREDGEGSDDMPS